VRGVGTKLGTATRASCSSRRATQNLRKLTAVGSIDAPRDCVLDRKWHRRVRDLKAQEANREMPTAETFADVWTVEAPTTVTRQENFFVIERRQAARNGNRQASLKPFASSAENSLKLSVDDGALRDGLPQP
jgi:hypothetical protein